MTAVSVELPDEVFSVFRQTPPEFVRNMQLTAAIHWYARGKISQEKAALIAGVARADFLDAVAAERIDVFTVDFDTLAAELARA
jgi:predicted HTH domain antitoxin